MCLHKNLYTSAHNSFIPNSQVRTETTQMSTKW